VACSATVDDEFPGVCELKCEGSSIASSNDMRMKPAFNLENITCIGNLAQGAVTELSGPVTITMIAEKPRNLKYKSPFETGEETPGANWQAAGGLSFEPIISGIMAGARTSPENATVTGDIVSPFKYAGIVTPKSEWCTDTCGIATIEVWPSCVGGVTVPTTIQFHSGALFSDLIEFEIKHEN